MRPDTQLEESLLILAKVLERYSFRAGREKPLQAAIAKVLTEHEVEFRREFILDAAGTLDFFLPPSGLAIEVKVGGSLAEVTRQVSGYLRTEAVAGLLLVTTRDRHRVLPTTLHGKPLRVLFLTGGLTG